MTMAANDLRGVANLDRRYMVDRIKVGRWPLCSATEYMKLGLTLEKQTNNLPPPPHYKYMMPGDWPIRNPGA